MTTPISRAAVLAILRTPAASDTFPDMIARVEALEPDGRLDRLRSAAQFLVDRLESFEPDDNDAERMTRDFYGHVVPAHERLMQILAALEPVAQPEDNAAALTEAQATIARQQVMLDRALESNGDMQTALRPFAQKHAWGPDDRFEIVLAGSYGSITGADLDRACAAVEAKHG